MKLLYGFWCVLMLGAIPVLGQDTVFVGGEVSHPFTFSGVPPASRVEVDIKDNDGSEHRYSGVPVVSLLEQAGAPLGGQLRGKNMTKYLLVRAADGYQVVFALAELDSAFSGKMVLLADQMDGKPLAADRGPYRLVVPDERKHARWIFKVQALLVESADH